MRQVTAATFIDTLHHIGILLHRYPSTKGRHDELL